MPVGRCRVVPFYGKVILQVLVKPVQLQTHYFMNLSCDFVAMMRMFLTDPFDIEYSRCVGV